MTDLKSLASKFWNDQTGFVISAELVLISTLLVLGLIVGLTSVQTAVVGELGDVGTAIGSLNQSYQYHGFVKTNRITGGDVSAFTAGSAFHDLRDLCDNNSQAMSCALSAGTVKPLPEAEAPHDHHSEKHHAKKKDKGKSRKNDRAE